MNLRVHAWLDRVGIAGAGLCTAHCAVMPLLLVGMPLSALSIGSRGTWQHELAWWVMRLHGYETLLVAVALVLASVSVGSGWWRHRHAAPAIVAVAAGICLIGGLQLRMPLSVHVGLLVIGGILLTLSHVLNFRCLRMHAPPQT